MVPPEEVLRIPLPLERGRSLEVVPVRGPDPLPLVRAEQVDVDSSGAEGRHRLVKRPRPRRDLGVLAGVGPSRHDVEGEGSVPVRERGRRRIDPTDGSSSGPEVDQGEGPGQGPHPGDEGFDGRIGEPGEIV